MFILQCDFHSSHWKVSSVSPFLKSGWGHVFASANGVQQKWCYVTSQAKSLIGCSFCLPVSLKKLATMLRGSPGHMKGPSRKKLRPSTFHQQSQPTCQPCEWATLGVNPPAQSSLWGDCSASWQLNITLMRGPNQNCPAKLPLNFWPRETMKDNNYCFKPLSFEVTSCVAVDYKYRCCCILLALYITLFLKFMSVFISNIDL